MKTLKILFALTIMLGIAAAGLSQGKGKQVVRPMKGIFYETPNLSKPGESFVTGNVTHMGNITGTSVADMSGAYWEGNVLKGVKNSKIKIAANGDKIFSEAFVTLIFNLPMDGTGTISAVAYTRGGTGRFEGCSGQVEALGTFNMNTGYKEYTVEGWIKY